ncbi:hypothetical protein LCGC14_0764440 [marine sediment metagenome]|uniref:Uncharacterized protein n=2 Tax=root TaxID=1 RepID=A0A831VRQ9_9FLAO|nr:hypothetical protein [Pricia antarctica]
MPLNYKEFVNALAVVRKYQKQITQHHMEDSQKLDSVSLYATVSRDTNIRSSKLSKRTLHIMNEEGLIDIFQGAVGGFGVPFLKED